MAVVGGFKFLEKDRQLLPIVGKFLCVFLIFCQINKEYCLNTSGSVGFCKGQYVQHALNKSKVNCRLCIREIEKGRRKYKACYLVTTKRIDSGCTLSINCIKL